MKREARPSILKEVARYYSARLHEFGATSRGVDWNSRDTHEIRHRQFLRLLETDPNASVIDFGCGFGDFLRFLREAGHRGHYVGYDVSFSMIDKARELHATKEFCEWHVGAEPTEAGDFAVASGVFNVKGSVPNDQWAQYVNDTIEMLARVGRIGFAFNMLSLSSDPDRRRSDLYYADPVALLNHCLSRFGRNVALLQDYGLYEFTAIIRHPPAS